MCKKQLGQKKHQDIAFLLQLLLVI